MTAKRVSSTTMRRGRRQGSGLVLAVHKHSPDPLPPRQWDSSLLPQVTPPRYHFQQVVVELDRLAEQASRLQYNCHPAPPPRAPTSSRSSPAQHDQPKSGFGRRPHCQELRSHTHWALQGGRGPASDVLILVNGQLVPMVVARRTHTDATLSSDARSASNSLPSTPGLARFSTST